MASDLEAQNKERALGQNRVDGIGGCIVASSRSALAMRRLMMHSLWSIVEKPS